VHLGARLGLNRDADDVDASTGTENETLADAAAGETPVVEEDAEAGPPDDGIPKRYVFVTSGDLDGVHPDGIAHFDGQCTAYAEGATGLEGKKFKAWLSTKKESALKHVGADAWKGKFVLVTGEVVAKNTADLTHNMLAKPITVDAYGNAVTTPDRVWTGTNADGTLADPDCKDWTDSEAKGWTGKTAGGSKGEWTHFEQSDCAGTALLYCFEAP